VIAGGRAQRQEEYRHDDFCKITNYEKLHRDLDLIANWAPDLVIVDEAQRVKNWNTIAARALKRIDSPYAVVLTGTPLENKLEELISIVQFVDQHRLGPTWKLLHEHQVKDEFGRVTGYTGLERIGQTLYPVCRTQKTDLLVELLKRQGHTRTLVFTRTKRGADRVAKHLEGCGVKVAAIHGNKSQAARTRALDGFKSGKVAVLVATDIAARGLDIDQLPQVVNFELPNVPEDYVHRIGRTGRAGAAGHALSLVDQDEMKYLKAIERLTRQPIVQLPAPTGWVASPVTATPSRPEASRPTDRRASAPVRRSGPARPRARSGAGSGAPKAA
jgi:superfamily II DNA or RNA helicase